MIVLDTSVLSEVLRAEPSPRVLSWFSAQDEETLCTTVVTQAEILAALAALPEGRRRTALEKAAALVFAENFHARVLSFDVDAAAQYPAILASRMRTGVAMRPLDGIVAAIAHANGASLATRHGPDFEGCGLVLHDPFKGS